LQETLESEIKPRGFIERMYVADISFILWETLRLRRCKAAIINTGYRAALGQLLSQLLRRPGQLNYSTKDEAEALALGWFSDQSVRQQVAEILGQFGLDESAIEAEAIRSLSADLELLDRMLTSLELRRNRALRCIGEYRDGLAKRLRESAERIVGQNEVLRLEDKSSKQSSAA
jgi:hypothetical protein